MTAIDEFGDQLETTEAIKQVLKSLREEPARLLGDICREYQATGQPVPDHHLDIFGYLGEASTKALISLGLIAKQEGGRTALYAFAPTSAGLEQYEKLKADGFYGK